MNAYIQFLNKLLLPISDFFISGSYMKNLRLWRRYDQATEYELAKIQRRKLNKILEHVSSNVPYYQGINSKDLKDFPILTKEILRAQTLDLISTQHEISKLDKHHSSGSSGIQSFTYMTKKHTFYLRALQTHWWQWSGYRIGSKLLQFGISQKRSALKQLKDFFYRCNYVKAFGLSNTDLDNILANFSTKKSIYIAGYPSVIQELAKRSRSSKINLDVNGIICFGDKLFNHYEADIRNSFGKKTPIIDTYGCAEGLLMACKSDLESYYIMSPHVFLEIVDDNGKPVEDGIIGNVLVTCLTNYAMPIIRYRLGDLAIMLPRQHYPKQRKYNYPLLQKIVGRDTDVIKTTKGITLNVHSFTGIFEYYQEIKQFKVVQHDLENLTIEYVFEEEHTSSEHQIIKEVSDKINDLTHQCLDIRFDKKQIIAPTASGKPQIIESHLKFHP